MSPVRRAFVILGVVAAVIAFLLMVAQDRETLKVRSAYGAEDPRHPSYTAALVGAALTSGNDYDVLTNGDQIFPAMLDAIRGAQRRISFETYENLIEAAGETTPGLDDAPQPLHEEGASLLVRSSPTGGSSDLKRLYLLALGSARRTVDITSPYFVTDESSEWSLKDAVKRGVKIRILVEGDLTDAMPVKYASREAYDRLLALGIEIYEYQPTMMHTKTLVVDGIWSMFGSANFDNRSLELNDELNLAVTNRDLARRVLDDFEQDLRAAARLELTRWRQRSLLEKTREQFWSYFGEVF